jgi:hypothetical protein
MCKSGTNTTAGWRESHSRTALARARLQQGKEARVPMMKRTEVKGDRQLVSHFMQLYNSSMPVGNFFINYICKN